MRIALVVPGGVDRSGEIRVIPALLALIGRLAEGHDVHVFALHQESEPAEWILAGARVHNIGTRHTRWRAVRAIGRMHDIAPFALVHAIWSGSCGLIAVIAARLLHIPSVIHVAGGELAALPDIGFGGGITLRGRLRERLVLGAASAVTAASAPVIGALAGLGVCARRLPLGVDIRGWARREPVMRRTDRPARLIHVASLNRVKDQGVLLRAMAALLAWGITVELDVVGEDTLQGEIEALAQSLGLDRQVRFHGFLPHRQLRPLVEAADVMVVTSRHETGPLVVLEAAIAGVPTVGTAVGHIAEWSPDAALSVPVGDWRGLAETLRRLLGDEPLRMRLAREALRRALREDADHTAEAFQTLYRGLVPL